MPNALNRRKVRRKVGTKWAKPKDDDDDDDI
jgi:hypothetical protein